MSVTIIAAIGLNRELGLNNQLLWHLPNDLKHFKKLTSGYTVLMGRKTYESIGRPLPNRENVVISRHCSSQDMPEGVQLHNNLVDFVKNSEKQIYVIGGGDIYRQVMATNIASNMIITKVYGAFEADTFFPEIDEAVWQLKKTEKYHKDATHAFDYDYLFFEKKSLI